MEDRRAETDQRGADEDHPVAVGEADDDQADQRQGGCHGQRIGEGLPVGIVPDQRLQHGSGGLEGQGDEAHLGKAEVMQVAQQRVDRQQQRLQRVIDQVPRRDREEHGIGGGLEAGRGDIGGGHGECLAGNPHRGQCRVGRLGMCDGSNRAKVEQRDPQWITLKTMRLGTILLIVASLTIITTSAVAQDAPAAKPSLLSQEPHPSMPISLPVRIIDGPPKTIAERQASEASEGREIENLAAQKSVAESTRFIVGLTFAQIVLALLGTLALLITLYFTSKSLAQSVTANENTRMAIKTEHENTQRSIRAYLGVNNINQIVALQEPRPMVEGEEADTFLIVDFQNFGQTPALDVIVFVRPAFHDQRPSREFFQISASEILEPYLRNAISRFVLFSGQKHQTKRPVFPVCDRNMLINPPLKNAFIFGVIHFADVFGAEWMQTFSFIRTPGMKDFVPYEHFNELLPEPHPYRTQVEGYPGVATAPSPSTAASP